MSRTTGIEVDVADITVRRGTTCVLEGFSLHVPAGSAIGVVGNNGAGKTTLLDALSGLVEIEGGSIRLDGRDHARTGAQQRYRLGVRRTFQESHLYPHLAVSDVLNVAARGTATSAPRGIKETAFVDELSTGQRRSLDVAAATAEGARLLLLDEPTAGIAQHERAALIATLREWRAQTGGTLIVVEHDRDALLQIVDDVVELPGTKPQPVIDPVTLNGSGAHHSHVGQRTTADVIADVAATRRAHRRPRPEGPSVWALARFGLREFAAGMLSVITLGVLNRVMKVDLGIPLLVVTPILAAYNLAAPAAIWIGARSDRHAFRGLHRTPYILAGAILMALGTIAAPFVAWRLADGIDPLTVALSLLVFALMGVGMYGSGATYFALLSEAVSVGRERAVAVVYSMLMAGILAGVALSAYVLPDYEPRALLSLHTVVALVIVVCTWWAVRGAEGRDAPIASAPTMRLRSFVRGAQPKRFFMFMVALTFFAFLQQGVLEPFGGDVFGLSVRATTSFNAIQITGVLIGMAAAARVLSPAIGRRTTTAVGIVVAAVGFGALAGSSVGRSTVLLYAGIAVMGLGLGVLNVGSLSLMLDMTAGHAAGLAMGLWTVAHAIADGAATASGGVLQTLLGAAVGTDAGAYAGVFAVEAIGLLAIIALLVRIDPERFKEEFDQIATAEGGTT